jgi:hypothetical protein
VILIQRLISSQYIDEGQLPNANGEFTLPPLYTTQPPTDSTMQSTYSLTLDHCKIPRDQLIKLGLEEEEKEVAEEISSAARCEGTQVFETQICTEKDFIATQTEVDQSFDLDMEIRTPSQKDEVQVSHNTTSRSRPSFKAPLVDPPPFASIINSVAISLPSGPEPSSEEDFTATVLPPADTTNIDIADPEGGDAGSPSQNFFTQNMTQESLLEMEKWLLSSSQQEDILPLENGNGQHNGGGHHPVEMGRENDYHVSSDDEPSQIKHYPLSANPKFLHKEVPEVLKNGEVVRQIGKLVESAQFSPSSTPTPLVESSPGRAVFAIDEESQTQPQMAYRETMNGHQQSHSVFLPDTLTSSWDSPPDIEIVVQASPSTPSQNELIGQQFFKNFPGTGVFRATVSDFHRYCRPPDPLTPFTLPTFLSLCLDYSPYYTIVYEDGKTEQLEESTVRFW